MVRFLHSEGANLETPANDGRTPVHFACSGGHVECVHELAWLGADLAVPTLDGSHAAYLPTQLSSMNEIAVFLAEVADAGGSVMWGRSLRLNRLLEANLKRRWPVVRMLALFGRRRAAPRGDELKGEVAVVRLGGALSLLSRPVPARVLPEALVRCVLAFL